MFSDTANLYLSLMLLEVLSGDFLCNFTLLRTTLVNIAACLLQKNLGLIQAWVMHLYNEILVVLMSLSNRNL